MEKNYESLLERFRYNQSLMNPNYVIQLQKVFQNIQYKNQSLTNVLSKFYENYHPIELNFPQLEIPKFKAPDLIIDTTQFTKITELLNTSISKLSAFEYNLIDFQKEEIEEGKYIDIIDNTKGLITDIYKNNNLLDVIDPRKFEEIIAELLYSKGFEVQLTKQTRDNGYDILALQKIGGFSIKFLVECKRWKNNIGVGVIRSFCDVIRQEHANKGIIFTTSYFSKDSQKRKNEMGEILDLEDRESIINWIAEYNN